MRILWCLLCAAGLALSAPAVEAAKPATIPLPRLKPRSLVSPAEPVAPPPALQFPETVAPSGWSKDAVREARLACASKIKSLQLNFTPMQPIGGPGGCGAPAPLRISAIAGVEIVPAAALTCDMAEALHGWLANSVKPSAKANLAKTLVHINNASDYACRRRNSQKTGKLSEHAKANALDIATLAFDDGSSVSIKGDWGGRKFAVQATAQARFLAEIRRYACIRFTTVLGPGSDPYHGDHFHVDVDRRKNGYRICN